MGNWKLFVIMGESEGVDVILEIGIVGPFSVVVMIVRDFGKGMKSFGIPEIPLVSLL